MPSQIHGSCLCGKIRFQLNSMLSGVRYCHCTNCRKFSGTSPAAWAMAESRSLNSSGNHHVSRFDSGRGVRCYCSSCGSPVWFESKDYPSIIGVPLGVIDSGPVPFPEVHLWVDSKPVWCNIFDDVPQFHEGPEET